VQEQLSVLVGGPKKGPVEGTEPAAPSHAA
jgi:hypothetical protein